MSPAQPHCAPPTSGSALVITLGLLAVLGLLVIGYVYSARTERFAARHSRERVTARQYADLALNDALEDITRWTRSQGTPARFDYVHFNNEGFIYAPPSQPYAGFQKRFSPNVCMSLDTNESPKIDKDMFTTVATNWIPRVLLEETEREEVRPYWLPIKGVNETTGDVTGTNGFIAYAIFNCSGLLDANFATSNQLAWLESEGLDIENLGLFLHDRARATATNGLVTQYLDLHDLRLRSRGLAGQPRNLFTWSYDPGPDVTVTNGMVYSNRDVQLVSKFNVNSWANDAQSDLNVWLRKVTSRFATIGFAAPEALAWNLLNFMDPDRIPQGPDENHNYWQEPWPVEDVPLINEVAVGMVPLEMSENRPNHYAPGVELWFPFATNRITEADKAQLVVAVYTNWVPDDMDLEGGDAWIEKVIYPDEEYGFTFSTNIPGMAYGTDTEFLTFTLPYPYVSFPVTVTNAMTNGSEPYVVPIVNGDFSRLKAAKSMHDDGRLSLVGQTRYLPLGIASYSTYLPDPENADVWLRSLITVTNTIHILPRVKLGDYWVDEAAGYHPDADSQPARTNLLYFTEPSGYEVNDPRRNGRFEDWKYYEASSRRVPAWELDPGIETLPICSLNGTTNLIANPWHLPYGQGLPLMHFNRLLDRAGDIGYIQQPESFPRFDDKTRTITNLWQSICLADPSVLATNKAGFAFAAGSVLEFFTVRATNTPVRGLVHFSTTHTNVVEALAADLVISGISNRTAYLPDTDVEWFRDAFFEAQEELYQTTPIGAGDLGFGFGASQVFRDVNALDDDFLRWQGSLGNEQKEDLVRGLAERVSFRQHVFVICLAGKTAAPSGRTTAIQRAVAIVLRDAYTGRWKVVSWQWLH